MNIRVATPEDAKALLEIYGPYVKETSISFEYEVPSEEEFKSRIKKIQTCYPYLIAYEGEQILGYAYAARFHPRAAYDWSVETTIYIRKDQRLSGVGRMLYESLERALKLQHVINLEACIAYPDMDDEYLTGNSTQFHAHMGYVKVADFKKCGYKFNRWYNMVWMEKSIAEHEIPPLPLIPFSEIQKEWEATAHEG